MTAIPIYKPLLSAALRSLYSSANEVNVSFGGKKATPTPFLFLFVCKALLARWLLAAVLLLCHADDSEALHVLEQRS